MSKKRICLTLDEKIEVLNSLDSGVNIKTICEKYRIGKTQVYDLRSKKEATRNQWEQSVISGSRKRMRSQPYEDLNNSVWKWFTAMRTKNILLSGPILQQKALELARQQGLTDFKASTGWLEKFRSRHGILFKNFFREARDVDSEIKTAWKEKLEQIVSGYDPSDLYNCDETALLYRMLPNKSLVLRDENCLGGKISKERLTVFLCCNMNGEFEKPLVIGKSKSPRCFGKISKAKLPVMWEFNANARMTATIMENWLHNFNKKMQKENRNVLLFLDNATYHTHITLTNVKLVFFPSNTTLILQPLDQGIIHIVKAHYRRLMIQALLAECNSWNNIWEASKMFSVLDAIEKLIASLKLVEKSSVSKCFKKAGFKCFSVSGEDDLSAHQQLQNILEVTEANINAEDCILFDQAIETEENRQIQFLSINSQCNEDDNIEVTTDEQEQERKNPIQSFSTSLLALKNVKRFFIQEGLEHSSSALQAVIEETEREILKQKHLRTKRYMQYNRYRDRIDIRNYFTSTS